MISADEFLEWCAIFGVQINGGGGGVPQDNITFISSDFSALSTGNTILFTVSAIPAFIIPVSIAFVATSVVGYTSEPTISVGSDAGGTPPYSNLLAPFDLTALTATGITQMFPLTNSTWVASGTTLRANVTTAAVATTFNVKVILKGIAINT